LKDLNYVLEQLPTDAAALHLKARIHLSLDQVDEALTAVDKACQLDPQEHEYSLTRARCYLQRGDIASAEQEANKVRLAEGGVDPLAKSRALALLGDILAHGAKRDYKAA